MLRGKTALITGGSGALGSAIARTFGREGATVAFSYNRGEEKAKALYDELSENEVRAYMYKAELLNKGDWEGIVKDLEEKEGGIDILVNNAAVAQVMGFPLIDEEDWDLLMNVNIKGPFVVTKAVVRRMISRRKGCIVNIGSLAGEKIMEVPVHYATTKSAVNGFTRSLAFELSRFNIRVNSVIPGLLNQGVGLNVPEKQRNDYCRFCTLKRIGEPSEVAEVVAFVASDRASYLNAQAIFVDGGI
ncbi:SDR family NAD(P)-dependent oxidoreductase [Candidatus Riflebacteria bacterium]